MNVRVVPARSAIAPITAESITLDALPRNEDIVFLPEQRRFATVRTQAVHVPGHEVVMEGVGCLSEREQSLADLCDLSTRQRPRQRVDS